MYTLLLNESPCEVVIIIIISIVLILIAPNIARKWIVGCFLIVMTFLGYFYRYPVVCSNISENILVSPCSGTITSISEIVVKNKPYINISAFLSPVDVHIQYAPCEMQMINKYHRDGGFDMAFLEKSKNNEHMVNIFNSHFGELYIIQIAGFLVRRIVSDLSPGEFVKRSDKIGMIKFGSRVDFIVPKESSKGMQLLVSPGDIVDGGLTPVVKYNESITTQMAH